MMSPAPAAQQDLLGDLELPLPSGKEGGEVARSVSAPLQILPGAVGAAPSPSSSSSRFKAPSRPARRPPDVIMSDLRNERCRGHIKYFKPESGWGFIISPKVQEILQTGTPDVFFHQTELFDDEPSSVQISSPVSFWCHLNKDNKPQARVVRLEPKTGSEKMPLSSKPASSPMDKKTYVEDEAATYLGTVKSFNEENGYGFITCEQTKLRFQRDVFLHKSQRQDFKAGDKVSFKINVEKGQPKAHALQAADPVPAAVTPNLDAPEPVQDEVEEGFMEGQPKVPAVVTPPNLDAPEPVPDEVEEGFIEAQSGWNKYIAEENQYWYWCEVDEEWFPESDPGDWVRYVDPGTDKKYWWYPSGR